MSTSGDSSHAEEQVQRGVEVLGEFGFSREEVEPIARDVVEAELLTGDLGAAGLELLIDQRAKESLLRWQTVRQRVSPDQQAIVDEIIASIEGRMTGPTTDESRDS